MLRAIVDQARQGDEEAFAALVREVGDRCIYIAHRILRDANLAEDAVQVALVQVWRELPDPARPRSVRGVAPSDPRQRLLRRSAARPALRDRCRPARDGRTGRRRRVPDGPRPRPAGPRLPATSAGAARRPRLPLRPRDDRARGRRSPRHPPRDREVPTVLRNRGDPGGSRSRRPDAASSTGSNWHDEASRSGRPPLRLSRGRDGGPARTGSSMPSWTRSIEPVSGASLGPRRAIFRTTLAAAAVIAIVVIGGSFYAMGGRRTPSLAPSATRARASRASWLQADPQDAAISSADPVRRARVPEGVWIATGTMGTPRGGHTAVRLLDGRVLVVGGSER